MNSVKTTPMMQQWHRCKEKAKEALLFFRLGDFYEAFYDDAICMAKELGLTLTSRQEIPMCGVPYQAAEPYLDKLLAKGYKIAIAEQLQDPKDVKGIVERDIVRFLSPGSLIQSRLLSDQSNNFFISIAQINQSFALGIIDISTGEFRVLETTDPREISGEICRLRPAELLVSRSFAEKQAAFLEDLSKEFSFLLNTQEDKFFDPFLCSDCLEEHFQVSSLHKLGLEGSFSEISAAGALLYYLKEKLYIELSHIQKLEKDPFTQFMSLDKTCLKNLNILASEDQPFSLIKVLDKTKTPMGARLLRNWIKRPLLQIHAIHERHDAVEEMISRIEDSSTLGQYLQNIRDIERLIMRIASGYASPKDFASLKESLLAAKKIQSLPPFKADLLVKAYAAIQCIDQVVSIIEEAIVDEPPYKLHDAPTFRKGYHERLDQLVELRANSQAWIATYQETLRKDLGIKTIKVAYTKAFGYYIDVSKAQAKNMPSSFVRKQTLTNSERFLSPELKEFEYTILSAEEKIKALEKTLFAELKEKVQPFTTSLQSLAKAIATVDVIYAFAENASLHQYTRPSIQEEDVLLIENGRHPIIERSLGFSAFIPNDTHFSSTSRMHIITGPNMAGKSTYIRQCALLVILAQAGSFVPASRMTLSPIHEVFSRIGASDDIASGASTFMVEMQETATILQNATPKSLVILDEIGRGTSTYDGISIAWAVAEFLLQKVPAKTLFATHYRELTDLPDAISSAKNYQVAVQEDRYGIVFLHKIRPGKAPKSYAIHVAKLAGLPPDCLNKAEKMLKKLEDGKLEEPLSTSSTEERIDATQLELFQKQEIFWIQEISKLSLDRMTPVEVQQKLYELQEKASLL